MFTGIVSKSGLSGEILDEFRLNNTEDFSRSILGLSIDSGSTPSVPNNVNSIISKYHGSGCPCCSRPESDGIGRLSFNTPSYGTLTQLANYLTSGYNIDQGANFNEGYYNLTDTGTHSKNGILTYNYSGNQFDSDGVASADWKNLYDEAFKYITATLGIAFNEETGNNADIDLTDNASGAYNSNSGTVESGNRITEWSRLNIAPSFSDPSSFGGYAWSTVVHELGHSLGLGHQGDYNGEINFSEEAVFGNDSWDVSMMSYVSQNNNPNFSGRTYTDSSSFKAADLLAFDNLYASQGYGTSNAFTGNTVYGHNTTIASGTSDIWNKLTTWIDTTGFTIADGAGNDTIDFSGFTQDQQLDLRATEASSTSPYYSTINGRQNNLSIAVNTVIENAITGSGNDSITGNSAANSIDGGGGTDTMLLTGALSDYSLSLSGSSLQLIDLRAGSPDGTDTLSNIEFVDFNGDTRSWAALLALVDTTGSGSGSGSGSGGGGGGGSGGGAPSGGGTTNVVQSIENTVINGRRYFTNKAESLVGQAGVNIGLLGGNDFLEITGGNNNFANGNKGADYIVLRGGQGRYLAGADNDRIEVFASEVGSWVNGNKGVDVVIGSVDGMTYRGGADNDRLLVSAGSVWGDKGADTFQAVAGAGVAVVQDYAVAQDVIQGIAGGAFTLTDQGLSYGAGGDQMLLLLGIFDSSQVAVI